MERFRDSAEFGRQLNWLSDCFFAITAPPQPNFELREVTDLRIAWSRAVKDATLKTAVSQTL
jgi:hypothetical protein